MEDVETRISHRNEELTLYGHSLDVVARPAGFEPATYGFVVRHSIQLSYGRTESLYLSRELWRFQGGIDFLGLRIGLDVGGGRDLSSMKGRRSCCQALRHRVHEPRDVARRSQTARNTHWSLDRQYLVFRVPPSMAGAAFSIIPSPSLPGYGLGLPPGRSLKQGKKPPHGKNQACAYDRDRELMPGEAPGKGPCRDLETW